MDATISQAAGGGIKGFLLKVVDPIFRKKGAGALVPIKVGGTREKPAIGLDVGKVFKKTSERTASARGEAPGRSRWRRPQSSSKS